MRKFLSVLSALILGVVMVGCVPQAPTEDEMNNGQGDAQAETGDEVALDDNGAEDAMDDEDDDSMDDEAEGNNQAGAAQPIVDAQTNLRVLGTEPFWSVLVTDNSLEWSEPAESGIDEETFAGLTTTQSGNATIYEDPNTNITVTITPAQGSCSDGMSDTAYPYDATVDYDGTTYEGCAEPESA